MPFIPPDEDYDRRALLHNPLAMGRPQRSLPPALRPGGGQEGIPRTLQYMNMQQAPGVSQAPTSQPAKKSFFNKENMGGIGQVLLALSSGLLSRGYGESGGQALGRGLQAAGSAGLQVGRQRRKKAAQDKLRELASSESVPPEDQEIYGILGELEDPSQGLGAFIQNRGADRRSLRSAEAADARALRSHERMMERGEYNFERTRGLPKKAQEDYVYTIVQAKSGNPHARKALRLPPDGTEISDEMQLAVDEWQKMNPLDAILRAATTGAAYPSLSPGQGKFSESDIR